MPVTCCCKRPSVRIPHQKETDKHGRAPQSLSQNSHEAIIDRQTFELSSKKLPPQRSSKRDYGAQNPNHDNSQKLFSGLIVCGCCGAAYVRKYTNIKNSDRPIWICGQYTKYGKSVCHSQQIPETILIEKVKEVLGTTRDKPNHRAGTYFPHHGSRTQSPDLRAKNGSSVDVFWKHPSRRLSWTDEMREAARQKTLMRYRKEEKL